MKFGYLRKDRSNPCVNLNEDQVIKIHGILHCDPPEDDMEPYNLYLVDTHKFNNTAFAYMPLEVGETYSSYCNRPLNSYHSEDGTNAHGIIWVDAMDIRIDASNAANKFALERLED